MQTAQWKRLGIIAGALVSLIALVSAAQPVLRSDAPPFAGVKRVQTTEQRMEAMYLRGNIRGTWRDYCAAIRGGNVALADTLNGALGDLQGEYATLTGDEFPLRSC